ncbi:411_t:CDS:1, partial [Gigaspora rosea]
ACTNEYLPLNTETVEWSPQNLNANHGSKFMFVGMYYEKGYPPVSSIDFLIQNDSGTRMPDYWKSSNIDLNSGADGKYIDLIWRTSEIEKNLFFRIRFMESKVKSPSYYNDGMLFIKIYVPEPVAITFRLL